MWRCTGPWWARWGGTGWFWCERCSAGAWCGVRHSIRPGRERFTTAPCRHAGSALTRSAEPAVPLNQGDRPGHHLILILGTGQNLIGKHLETTPDEHPGRSRRIQIRRGTTRRSPGRPTSWSGRRPFSCTVSSRFRCGLVVRWPGKGRSPPTAVWIRTRSSGLRHPNSATQCSPVKPGGARRARSGHHFLAARATPGTPMPGHSILAQGQPLRDNS